MVWEFWKGEGLGMISEVIIPDLGGTGGDVVIEQWLVQPGEEVKAGQSLFVVTTDKATVEVEAFRDGLLLQINAGVGEKVSLGSVVALLADSMDEPIAGRQPETTQSEGTPPPASQSSLPGPAPETGDRILASPIARRMAQAEKIDLSTLQGTGADGQILKRDVLAEMAARRAPETSPSQEGLTRTALSPMRQAIAERTQRSLSEIPHFHAAITIDMAKAQDLRRQAVAWAAQNDWAQPSMTDLCIRAAALALRQFPALNASLQADTLITYSEINIGLVIGLAEGILIPVVHSADRLDLFNLAARTRRLRQEATAGRLSAQDLSAGTFTLSNLGMHGLDSFTAVINPPQAGILALGAIKEGPAVVEGALVVRPLMTATLSVDHRIIDGVTAAEFAAAFRELLENPFGLTLAGPQEQPR